MPLPTDLPAAFLGPSGREPRPWWRVVEHHRAGYWPFKHYEPEERADWMEDRAT
jgi:hypothetical protein